jgi:hypothetical protein
MLHGLVDITWEAGKSKLDGAPGAILGIEHPCLPDGRIELFLRAHEVQGHIDDACRATADAIDVKFLTDLNAAAAAALAQQKAGGS